MTRILISAPYIIPVLDRFRPLLEGRGLELIVPEVEERLEEDQLLELAGSFDGVICGDDRFTRRVIQACSPRLKVISKWGTGIDSIDSAACQEFEVMLGNTPNAFTEPVADSVLAYILAFARQIPWMNESMKSGVWEKLPGRALRECTLGVVGVGNIGRAVVRRARSFGMRVLGTDIKEIDPAFITANQLEMHSLEVLLTESEFVSLNCDLNPTSIQLINKDRLQLMKPTGVLINTARGPIVDEEALILALREKWIAGAALDVYEFEPLPADSPLREFPRVMLAAHNSNSSPQAWEKVHWNTIQNLLIGLEIPFQTNSKGEIL